MYKNDIWSPKKFIGWPLQKCFRQKSENHPYTNTVPSLKSPHPFIKHFFIATVKCLFWNIYSCTHILWKWEQFEICDKQKNINVCQCKKQLHRSVQWVAACVGDNHMMINDKNSCIDSHFLLSLSGTASSYPWSNDQRLTVTEMLLV